MPIQIDDTVRNSDWLRSQVWDINPPTLSRLFEVLRVKDGSTIAKRDALVNFLLLPSAEPMPKGLENLVKTFLATTKVPQSVGSDVTEKTIMPILPEEIDIAAIVEPTEKSIPLEQSFVFMFDDVPAVQLPLGFEEQFPVIPDGVDMIELSPELEKSVFDLFGHILTVVRGFFGRWVTLKGGRRIFVKIKNTFNSDVTSKDARSAGLAFKKLPLAARKKIRRMRVQDRNIVEKILPEKTIPFLTRKKGYRVGAFDPVTSELTIRPGRLRVLNSLTQSPTTLIGGKRIKKPVIDVGDLVNRGGGRAMFPSFKEVGSSTKIPPAFKIVRGKRVGIKQTGKVVDTKLFVFNTGAEGGVTRLAEKTRLQMARTTAFNTTDRQTDIMLHAAGQENFSELFMIYTRRNSKFRTDWNRIKRTHPQSVKAFLNLLEDLNAK